MRIYLDGQAREVEDGVDLDSQERYTFATDGNHLTASPGYGIPRRVSNLVHTTPAELAADLYEQGGITLDQQDQIVAQDTAAESKRLRAIRDGIEASGKFHSLHKFRVAHSFRHNRLEIRATSKFATATHYYSEITGKFHTINF
jgi:hypothetical protein